MKTSFVRTLGLTAALGAAVCAFTAAPASAAAAVPKPDCEVSVDEQPVGGWSMWTTYRSKGVTCKQAKVVMSACGNQKSVAGWKLSKTKSYGFRFTSRTNAKRKFAVQVVGGTPDCISEFLGY